MRVERKRKNLRLVSWDYSASGYYFVTICTKERGEILCRDLHTPCRGAHCAPAQQPTIQFPLSHIGEVVQNAICEIPRRYPSVFVDKYVIMPNHIHIILALTDVDYHGRALRAPTVSRLVNQMKGYVTKQLGFSIWQKSFYDHVIRDKEEYLRIWQYIDTNPLKWELDCYYDTGFHEIAQKGRNL